MPYVNRRLARSIALQALFEWDIQCERQTAAPRSKGVIFDTCFDEFYPNESSTTRARRYAWHMLCCTCSHQEESDACIRIAAPEWPLEKIARVDRLNLRMALSGLCRHNTPSDRIRDSIDEAVWIAQTFGSESSARFVNKVLVKAYLNQALNRLSKESLRQQYD